MGDESRGLFERCTSLVAESDEGQMKVTVYQGVITG